MDFFEEQAVGVDIDDAYLRSVGYQERATPEPATRHKLQSRVRTLDAEVQEAKCRALRSDDARSVWAELVKMAESQEGVLLGYVSEGVQYMGKKHQETGEPDVFTLKALRDKMRRARRQ